MSNPASTRRCGILLLSISVVLVSTSRAALAQPKSLDDPPTAPAAARRDAYVETFLNEYFTAQPDHAVNAGRHEFDGQLPDWSTAGLRRESERLNAQRDKALAFKEADLDERRRFERNYLLAEIENQ